MKRLNFFVLCIISLTLTPLFSQDQALDQEDIKALRDWIKTKRQVTVKDRGGSLSLSGEVRAELQSTNEKVSGVKQLGSSGQQKNTPMRAWDVEANLLLDYKTDRTWSAIKIKFDNDAGAQTGVNNKIALNRAVFGGRILDGETYNMSLEVGRRSLGYSFDSKVQFRVNMDGILYQYDQAFDDIGDLYFHGGPFLINDTIDQYGYVGELGLLNIGQTGVYTKFSAIDWSTKKTDSATRNDAFRFLNLQWLLGYKFNPKSLNKDVTLYGAALVNTLAKKHVLMHNKKERWAWYAGFSVGKLKKKRDWSLDINYQWVQAQAVPDFDGAGIGRGNSRKMGLYSSKPAGQGKPITPEQTIGAGNYKGLAIEFLYLLSDNITVYQSWNHSFNQNKHIGPPISYKQYEIELIYSF